jgi:hypothetical protein
MRFLGLILTAILTPVIAFADTPIITFARTISVTPTINTAAYTAGDAVGGLQTLSGAGRFGVHTGVIHSVVVTDLSDQSADLDIIIFSSNPSGTTVTNNSALDIADADLSKVVCVIQVTSHASFADNGVSFAHGTNCVFESADGVLYAAVVARDTPTYAAASDLTFRYSILQD